MSAFYAGLILGAVLASAVCAVLWYGRRALLDRAREPDVTIHYADPAAHWAINEAGGPVCVQLGMAFDAFKPGTVLTGPDGPGRAARLGDDGEWEVQYGGVPFDPRDVRRMFIEGDLVLLSPAGPASGRGGSDG